MPARLCVAVSQTLWLLLPRVWPLRSCAPRPARHGSSPTPWQPVFQDLLNEASLRSWSDALTCGLPRDNYEALVGAGVTGEDVKHLETFGTDGTGGQGGIDVMLPHRFLISSLSLHPFFLLQ